jgi:hypothetical protein
MRSSTIVRTKRPVRAGTLLFVILSLLIGGCTTLPEPARTGVSSPEARALLESAAQAHGKEAFQRIRDISVSFDGEWAGLVKRFQPVLIDDQFRGSSEERMLLADDAIGQTHRGPGGVKQVFRRPGEVRVRYNGSPDDDQAVEAAAALVADGYRLFLLGPLYVIRRADAQLELAGEGWVDGRHCDRLLARLRPGLGTAEADRVLLYIDKQDRLMRRVRFSLEGLDTTRGAIAEVDVWDYVDVQGVKWPTQFYERLRKPLPMLPVHRWSLTGLDVNRGYVVSDIEGPAFAGLAAAPAKRIRD